MSKQPLITFHVNSFNRLPLIRNLLQSFVVCNEYPAVEWVITDYGSTDGSRQYLQDFAGQAAFPVTIILGDENAYFQQVAAHGLPITERWHRFKAIMGHFRNEARSAAAGEYYFDIADDHQFIRRGPWVEELLAILEHRAQNVGRADVAGIVPYGYIRWRLDKANNARYPQQLAGDVPYYVAKEKHYVDYSFMSAAVYHQVGPFSEPTLIQPNTKEWQMWINQDPWIQPESEYEQRCGAQGLHRIFMKYPITVSFPNDILKKQTPQTGELLAPLWTLEHMQKKFATIDRPVSSDELLPQSVSIQMTNRLKALIGR